MRLWHEGLLPYLPRQQLLGLHREVCALRGKGWGRKHSVVDYVFTHPIEWLWAYHMRVMKEMLNRGYHPDKVWFDVTYRGKDLGTMTQEEQEAIDVDDINAKLAATEVYIYPEHDDAYLEECLQNLEAKGINLRDKIKENLFSSPEK